MLIEWLQDNKMDPNFEEYPKEKLAEMLRQFYSSARKQTISEDQEEGEVYQKQSLVNIRSAINQHLQNPPPP